MSNLYIKEVHLTYGSLLLEQGDNEQGLEVLRRVVGRCTYTFWNYGPASTSEDGKFERFYLDRIAKDARKLIAKTAGQ